MDSAACPCAVLHGPEPVESREQVAEYLAEAIAAVESRGGAVSGYATRGGHVAPAASPSSALRETITEELAHTKSLMDTEEQGQINLLEEEDGEILAATCPKVVTVKVAMDSGAVRNAVNP